MNQLSNWIDGRARPALEGGLFEVRAARGREGLGRWPRSSGADVRDALDAADRAARTWAAIAPGRRAGLLARAAAHLAAAIDHDASTRAALGIDEDEGAALTRRVGRALKEGVERGRSAEAEAGVVLVAPHWSELWTGAGHTVLRHLAAGRTVIQLSDPRLPMVADRIAEALAAAELPPGVFAVLHDDGRTALRAALASGRCTLCEASGRAPDRRAFERPLSVSLVPGEGAWLPFGAGVIERHTRIEFETLRGTDSEVLRSEDPRRRAERAAAQAFGRVESLSGQHATGLRRVRIHRELFSVFTGELLDCLEASGAFDEPLPFLEDATRADLLAARDLGLDEGATLIHEGLRQGSPSGRAGASLVRLVFTNVEPQMRLAALPGPLPLLLLMRTDVCRSGDGNVAD
ncbi:MAG: aldehyde dehydrogenase family protein [bacterium]|nr:aldehyde dehydrogenase family protein [bacterium]